MLISGWIEAFGYDNTLEDKYVEKHKTPLEMVMEYKRAADQKPTALMSLNLIIEEYKEWEESPTVEDELKELADLVYVIYGYADTMGWNLDEALKRVHENNMGRMFQEDGTIKRREDGKVVKRPGYPKVDLSDLV